MIKRERGGRGWTKMYNSIKTIKIKKKKKILTKILKKEQQVLSTAEPSLHPLVVYHLGMIRLVQDCEQNSRVETSQCLPWDNIPSDKERVSVIHVYAYYCPLADFLLKHYGRTVSVQTGSFRDSEPWTNQPQWELFFFYHISI